MVDGNDEHYSGGGEKTVTKSVILRKYLWAYLQVMKNNWYGPKWYVDTHAGTGFSRELEVEIPGSAVRALRQDFDRYFFYEYNEDHFETLVRTIETEVDVDLQRGKLQNTDEDVPVATCDDPQIRVLNMDCNDGVTWLADEANDHSHWFTFVDPEGFSVERKLMEKLRDRGQMDILFNFQTTAYYRNQDQDADGADSAAINLGSDFPRDASEDELVKWYEDTVFRDNDWMATARSMVSTGGSDWRYDLIFASQNSTAMKIIGDIYESDLENDVTEEIERARAERGSPQQGIASFDVHDPDERVTSENQSTIGEF